MNRFLYIFFFGFANLKWRRLIRTFLLLSLIIPIAFSIDELAHYDNDFLHNLFWHFFAINVYSLVWFLISWLIYPFINKENK
jgi:hypothetical protein